MEKVPYDQVKILVEEGLCPKCRSKDISHQTTIQKDGWIIYVKCIACGYKIEGKVAPENKIKCHATAIKQEQTLSKLIGPQRDLFNEAQKAVEKAFERIMITDNDPSTREKIENEIYKFLMSLHRAGVRYRRTIYIDDNRIVFFFRKMKERIRRWIRRKG